FTIMDILSLIYNYGYLIPDLQLWISYPRFTIMDILSLIYNYGYLIPDLQLWIS
ncbi:hypothetical protein LOTGIDRAFT_135651, partial [Lottia gigantea]